MPGPSISIALKPDDAAPLQTWRLANAEEARDSDPRQCSIPRSEQRRSRRPKDMVRLRFETNDERFNGTTVVNDVWVEVSQAENGVYRGVVKDGHTLLRQIEGQEIAFRPEHIFAVILPDEYELPYSLEVLVSAAVLEWDQWPAALLRTEPTSPSDSGWRVLAKAEPPSSAVLPVQGMEIIRRFQVLDSVLDEPGLWVWTWCESSREYKREGG